MNNTQAISHAIMTDLTLQPQDKAKLLKLVNTNGTNSIIPSAVSNLAVKFNSLHPATQIILSILGFGVGRYLLDKDGGHDKMVNLDKPTNGYILKQ